jgi:hypothetical protein
MSTREGVSANPGDGEPSRARRRGAEGVEANARLTGSTAAALFVLLAAEGITILRVGPLLSWHIFIGMLLVPPIALKIGTTSYRFIRYYRGSPAYRRKGPPPPFLRLVGPFVVVLTIVVLATGIALLLVPPSQRRTMLFLHKASFVLWFGAMAIHVVGHLLDTAKLAPRDWIRRSRRDVAGAGIRQWVLVSSLGAGVLLGILLVGQASPWLASSSRYGGRAVHGHNGRSLHAASESTPVVGGGAGHDQKPVQPSAPPAEAPVLGTPAGATGQAANAVPQARSSPAHRTAAHRSKRRQGSRSHRSETATLPAMTG